MKIHLVSLVSQLFPLCGFFRWVAVRSNIRVASAACRSFQEAIAVGNLEAGCHASRGPKEVADLIRGVTTPQKINMEPETDDLEDDFPCLGVYSQVPC